MRMNLFFLFVIVLSVLTGCKKISSIADPQQPDPDGPPLLTPIGTPVGNPVSKTIGSGGGSLTSSDGKMELSIPAGALNSNTNITIQPVTNEAPGGLGLSYDLLPDGIKFGKPVTLIFHYTDAEVPDNVPYFLFIAFQDSSGAWNADFEQRDFDTVAKTVSLDVDHFTVFTKFDALPIEMHGWPLTLNENGISTIGIKETVFNKKGRIIKSDFLPRKLIDAWFVNNSKNGNITDGTIEQVGSGPGAIVLYNAPMIIDKKRVVKVWVDINDRFDIYTQIFKKGKKINLVKVQRWVDITLVPSVFDYSVEIQFKDQNISGHGEPGVASQVYEDQASFDLRLQVIKDSMGFPTVRVLGSNYKHHKPTVNPISQTYPDPFGFSSFTWEWIPDAIGMTNITGVTLIDYDPTDSTVDLHLVHTGAVYPGFNWKTGIGTSGTVLPLPFGGSNGMPSSLHMKLERKDQSSPFIKIKAK